MSFQRIVLTVALVTLIIVLCIVAYLIHAAKEDVAFPPETPACPDYFESRGEQKCENVQGLGNAAPGVTNFAIANGATMSCPKNQPCSESALVARCKWAKQHGLTWDGVSNRTQRIKNPSGQGTIIRPLC
tara:strand:- start:156 stop:545 length:390 start_codon:yes stop_codon:yes gene_type:complete